MSEENRLLIQKFYHSFAQKDAESMVECYAEDIVFEDPAFGQLQGPEAKNMWRMLIDRGKDSLQVTYGNIDADQHSGSASWEASYLFSKTGRQVHNKINARFKFDRGKIIWHKDTFNFWRWSTMALGIPGLILGFTPLLKNKVRKEALKGLANFTEKQNIS